MEYPKISAIFDYIVEVDGKYNYKQHQIYNIKDNADIKLYLLSATQDKAYLLLNKAMFQGIKIGDEIVERKNDFVVQSSSKMFGNIIDISSNIIFPNPTKITEFDIKGEAKAFGDVHDLMKVKTLNEQLYTGLNIVDLMIPIGKGQRQLIIGDRKTGKTHIAMNVIINQAKLNTKCIYVSIGQKREEVNRIYNNLKEFGILDNVIILAASSTSSYEQYLVPYIAMAHAENISHDNDVLIVFDDLTKHANIFREISLLIDKPVGKEAMPSDMFFAHSSLLERAGSFINKKTITALPIVRTIDSDITSLIASNVISITDGQIVTNVDLYSKNKLPAIDINLSVSRTGSAVQNSSVTKISGEISKAFYKYKRQIKLASMDYELNKEASDVLYKGKKIEKMFEQKGYSIHSENTTLLMSKLIIWDTLKGIDDEQKAIRFIDEFITHDIQANRSYISITHESNYDDEIIKNYFAYALYLYSQTNDLNWNVNCSYQFIIDQKIIDAISKKLGDK